MTAVNFTKDKNTLTGGSYFFVSTPFCDAKSTEFLTQPLFATQNRRQKVAIMECVSSWNPSFVVRRNRPILDVRASGRTDGRMGKF